jgi:hypothetical protein
MSIVRSSALLGFITTIVCGCATHLSADAPSGLSLAGRWKLDHAASDDPQKILADMRAEAIKLIRRQQADMAYRTGTAPPDSPDAPAPAGAAAGPPAGQPPGPRRDPLRNSPMAAVIREVAERGDFLTIRQSPSEFVLDYGTTRRSFTPGGHSVVSSEGGVGDQTSGWHGRQFIIRIKPQMGSDIIDTYELSPDGKQLIENLQLDSAELAKVNMRRVYVPTTEAAPRPLPNTD